MKKVHLECCCCGAYAGKWQQHHNRDNGYGICAKCVTWMTTPPNPKRTATTAEEIADLYGIEGVNWGAFEE